jgi:hypothetical protein
MWRAICFRPDAAGVVASAVVPGAFILAEHKLAVAVHALVPLYNFAAAALKRARVAESAVGSEAEAEAEEDAISTSAANNVASADGAAAAGGGSGGGEGGRGGAAVLEIGVDPLTGVDALRLLLLVNGEHTTAWNGQGLVPVLCIARHVIGYHLTQETRVYTTA